MTTATPKKIPTINVNARPTKGKKPVLFRSIGNGVFVDDYPFLWTLRPVGVIKQYRYEYLRILNRSLSNSLLQPQLTAFFQDVAGASEKAWSSYGWVQLCCSKPFGQEAMHGVRLFIEQNLQNFMVTNVVAPPIEPINAQSEVWPGMDEIDQFSTP